MAEGLQVLLAGGTGLVGRALLQALLVDAQVAGVHALARREVPEWARLAPRLQVHRCADGLAPPGPTPPLPRLDEAYIALGTTLRQAGSREAFRAVDFDAVLACARAARAAGARRLLVVSAHGADARSAVFYNRVKGEAEAALAALGFEQTVFARPSLLLGDRAALGQPARRAEALAQRWLAPLGRCLPAAVRPIPAEVVARALHAAARSPARGLRVLSSAEMQA